MDITEVFKAFVGELKKRTCLMTEDNVRYYWFASMLLQDNNLNNYTLEHPYNGDLKGKELDLLYEDTKTRWCFEMKFHRNPGRSAFPHTDSAGDIFSDINRLPFFYNENPSKNNFLYFLYVTDYAMHQYLSNISSRSTENAEYRQELKKFYNARLGDVFSVEYYKKSPKTFLRSLNDYNRTCSPKLVLCQKDDFLCKSLSFKNNMCHVRLYRVVL